MPTFILNFEAEMMNLYSLKLENHRFDIAIKCACGTENKSAFIDRDEPVELEHARGEAHLVIKCKGCSKTNTATVLEQKTIPGVYYEDCSGPEPMAAIDCRGIEVTGWTLRDGFSAIAGEDENGTVVEDIDFSEGDFYDYADPVGEVSITNVSTSIQRDNKQLATARDRAYAKRNK